MAKYSLTNKAVEDLAKIWNYSFEEWSEQQADTYYEMLIASCQEIAENLSLGKTYNGITAHLLGLRTIRHIIFYRRINENEVGIIRILHGRMDLKNRMSE